MYIIKTYNKETGELYGWTTVTSNFEEAVWLQNQYHQRGIGCVVRNTETGAEF